MTTPATTKQDQDFKYRGWSEVYKEDVQRIVHYNAEGKHITPPKDPERDYGGFGRTRG